VFQHYAISNSSKYFSQPEQFLPERWLKGSGYKHHPFASLPFGYGKRMCLGRRFADLELQTVVSKVYYVYVIMTNVLPTLTVNEISIYIMMTYCNCFAIDISEF